MLIYLGTSILFALLYAGLLLRYLKDWQSIPIYKTDPKQKEQTTRVSILVPARNEAANIQTCIQALIQQDYDQSLTEILVIDDHSGDDTAELAEAFDDPRLRVLRLSDYPDLPQQSGKKLALSTAIKEAKGELLVTTDADCYMNREWLSTIVAFYKETNAKMIAAPVAMVDERSLLEKFQSLDFCGMMGITGAGIHKGYMLMGNGANIAYPKAAFEEVKGFEGIDHLASGDDMLLMQKIAAIYPGQIHFLKNRAAVVYTKAQVTWAAFIQQRIRWASKSSAYPQKGVTLQLAIVYLYCCNLLLSICLLPFWRMAWILVLGQMLIKVLVDYALLHTMTSFFKRSDLMRVFLPSQVLHVLYIVGIGTLGNVVKRYKWKGRQVR